LLQSLVGLGLAVAAFGLTFGGPRAKFWTRMTCTGALLGGLAIAADPEARRPRLAPRDLLQGLLSAAGLYLIFQVADRLVRRLLPSGAGEINQIYALRNLRPRLELAARLGTIIGPAEELFWRGYLQRRLERRFGPWAGAALTVLAYASVHVSARNLTLAGAAAVAGLYWGTLARLGLSMPALIVSHMTWDIWIFLIAPTQHPPPHSSS
jgi:membrane protease YdiL (CAAX protease family)